MKTLNLVLKYCWFDLIKSGAKSFEYREYKPYWNKKFEGRTGEYKFVKFRRGYGKNAEIMLFKIENIWLYDGENDLNLRPVWAIYLGERIE